MTFSPGVLSGAADRLTAGPDPTWDNPAMWGRLNMQGANPSGYQTNVMTTLAREHKVSVVGPHGIGKTFTDACVLYWFAKTREARGIDWKVITTAGAWRQLQRYLWPEVHKWGMRLREPLPKGGLQTLGLKLHYGQAFAVASDDPANIEGAHADEILYIIDEAKNVPSDTWDAIEGALASGNAYVLANSTPGKAEGRLYEIHAKHPGFEDWTTIHVTLEDAIEAGRIRPEWAAQRAKQWGEKSPIYLNRVRGEFSTTDSDGVIPLEWLEAANDRWEDLRLDGKLEKLGLTAVAADVASEEGVDKTIIGRAHGLVMVEREIYPNIDTMQTSDLVRDLVRSKGPKKLTKKTTPIAVIDAIGVGTGTVDALRREGIKVDAFMGSAKAKYQDRTKELTFLNRRAEAYWCLRDLLDPTAHGPDGPMIAIPGGDAYATLTGDLVTVKYEEIGRGIKMEDKDEVIKRLGRSPDEGDMVVMLFNARLDRGTNLLDAVPRSLGQTSKWGKMGANRGR